MAQWLRVHAPEEGAWVASWSGKYILLAATKDPAKDWHSQMNKYLKKKHGIYSMQAATGLIRGVSVWGWEQEPG